MSKNNYHGLKRHNAMDVMCRRDTLNKERVGRFGRMFKGQQPLYTDPAVLFKLGGLDGPMDSMGVQKRTDTVPLGFVFLGQFIDHDITLDTTSKLDAVNDPASIENFRSPSLDLDCIFGEGPEDEPFLYEKNSKRLLTGATNKNHGQLPHLWQYDLARNAEGVAMIGDPRNDENRIVSQLQLAFIKFYNACYTELEEEHPLWPPNRIYEEARREVTNHYHRIIISEFLPTFCGTKIMERVMHEGRKYYTPCHEAYIPVEFSVAAYRFGHGMVKGNMRLQPGGPVYGLFSPELGFGFSSVKSHDEVIDWKAFFDFDGSHQKAAQLGPQLATNLLNLPFAPAPHNSLAVRNLLRGNSYQMQSGETVATCMGRPTDEIQKVKDFVEKLVNPAGISFKGGTPLWLYILSEAQAIGRQDLDGDKPGEGLGPVGGTIVAEVLMGLMELDNNSFLNTNRNWQPRNGAFTMKDLLSKQYEPDVVYDPYTSGYPN